MRIVTRPDFDGVVCAMLLYEAETITEPVKWTEPSDMQKGAVDVKSVDIIANLPYHPKCGIWFDHHCTNKIDVPFKGLFRIAPSAARLVFEYYQDRFVRDYTDLVNQADKIDSANLTLEEVQHPETNAYVLLSMSLSGHDKLNEPYWNRLIQLLRTSRIDAIMLDPEVKSRCEDVMRINWDYQSLLKQHTRLVEHVSITDFRPVKKVLSGNRFLVYSLFPEAVVNMKIRYDEKDRERMIVNVGHSIFNNNCRVNVGVMLSKFEGGGHRGAGACTFHASKADQYISEIIETLLKNEPLKGADA